MKKTNSKKGFTLVELVIVIAVIAILSAILVPTFSSVIGSANKTKLESAIRANIVEFLSENTTEAAASAIDEATFEGVLDSSKTYYYTYKNGALEEVSAPDDASSYSDFVGGNTTYTIKWSNSTGWTTGTKWGTTSTGTGE